MAAYLLTEPSSIAANPPDPRAPTTSMSAPAPLSVTASAGGPGQQAGIDERPRGDFPRPRDGLAQRAGGFAGQLVGDRLRDRVARAHARRQGGRRHDPQRRPVPLCLQRGPFHGAQRFLRTVHGRHDGHRCHDYLLGLLDGLAYSWLPTRTARSARRAV